MKLLLAKIVIACAGQGGGTGDVCMAQADIVKANSRLECTRDIVAAHNAALGERTEEHSVAFCMDADKAPEYVRAESAALRAMGYEVVWK